MNSEVRFFPNIDSIDAELRELVVALNNVPGVVTVDSCFGHPGRTCNHHTYFFIGVRAAKDKQHLFDEFWQTFFNKYAGKTFTDKYGYVQFVMTVGLFNCYSGIRLQCSPEHDPGDTEDGHREKLCAIQMALDFARNFIKA